MQWDMLDPVGDTLRHGPLEELIYRRATSPGGRSGVLTAVHGLMHEWKDRGDCPDPAQVDRIQLIQNPRLAGPELPPRFWCLSSMRPASKEMRYLQGPAQGPVLQLQSRNFDYFQDKMFLTQLLKVKVNVGYTITVEMVRQEIDQQELHGSTFARANAGTIHGMPKFLT